MYRLTACLLASNVIRLTKQEICRRKSISTAMAAYSEKIFTAGIVERAPARHKLSSNEPSK